MLVQTDSLGKSYGDLHALRDCTLSVQEGEVFGILGPNGAGKSTLIRLLLGFLKPSAGSATIMDFDCSQQSVDVHRVVAYLPAEARLFPSMRGKDVLKFFARIRGIQDTQNAMSIADRLQLDTRRRVAAMSTGMKQKLALAATLAAETPIIVLDEPTANLDPTIRREVMQLVIEAKHAGKTVLFSSHVLPEVEEACDRIVVLRSGELVHTQVMSELRLQHTIKLRANGVAISVPPGLLDVIKEPTHDDDETIFAVRGELSDALSWLATLELSEVRVEPVGLKAIYDRFHPPSSFIGHVDAPVAADA